MSQRDSICKKYEKIDFVLIALATGFKEVCWSEVVSSKTEDTLHIINLYYILPYWFGNVTSIDNSIIIHNNIIDDDNDDGDGEKE